MHLLCKSIHLFAFIVSCANSVHDRHSPIRADVDSFTLIISRFVASLLSAAIAAIVIAIRRSPDICQQLSGSLTLIISCANSAHDPIRHSSIIPACWLSCTHYITLHSNIHYFLLSASKLVFCEKSSVAPKCLRKQNFLFSHLSCNGSLFPFSHLNISNVINRKCCPIQQ